MTGVNHEERWDGHAVLSVDNTPPSINNAKSGMRAHWSVAHNTKRKEWEDAIWMPLFLVHRIPKSLRFVHIEAMLFFTTPNTRRDPENFRPLLAKTFADALVRAGYLPDDTADYFEMDTLKISAEKLSVPKGSQIKGQTVVYMDYLLGSSPARR